MPLIAAALTVAVVAGLLYLRPPAGHAVALPSPTPSAPTLDSDFFAAYDFVTPALGWAAVETIEDPSVGPNRFWIFRTADGAQHWALQRQGSVDAWTGVSFTFFDRSRGLVVLGGGAAAYRTSDGGAHWLAITLPPITGVQVTFADPQHGWFAGGPVANGKGGALELYRTFDSGTTWERLPDPPAAGFSFRDANEGWSAVEDERGKGSAFVTWDGGRTWDRATVPPPAPPADGAVFEGASVWLLPHQGVLVATGTSGFVSFDHGATWRELAPMPVGVRFSDLAFQDATHWWAMPFGNLYKTSDAGKTWQHVILQLDSWKYYVGVIDSSHAWALLDAEALTGQPTGTTGLALTSDGGRSWKYANVPVPV